MTIVFYIPAYSVDATGGVIKCIDASIGNLDQVFLEVKSIDRNALYSAFRGCTGLTGPVSFPALTSIGYQGLYGAFNGCTGLTGSVSFPVLTTVASAGLAGAFNGCTGLAGSVSFPALTSIGNQGLSGAFTGCTGLTEIHFKASLSGNSQCTAANMRCTNATVYFDL